MFRLKKGLSYTFYILSRNEYRLESNWRGEDSHLKLEWDTPDYYPGIKIDFFKCLFRRKNVELKEYFPTDSAHLK